MECRSRQLGQADLRGPEYCVSRGDCCRAGEVVRRRHINPLIQFYPRLFVEEKSVRDTAPVLVCNPSWGI